jgi:hypothetical protein
VSAKTATKRKATIKATIKTKIKAAATTKRKKVAERLNLNPKAR